MKGQEYCKGVSTYMSEDSDNKDGQVVLEDKNGKKIKLITIIGCLLYTSPSPRDA